MDRKKFVREENVPRRRDTCFRRDANERNIIRRSRCELCERNRTVLDAYFTGRIEKRLSRKRYLPRRRIYFIILSYHERNTIHRPRRTNRTNGISVVGASCGRIAKIVRGERVSSEEEGDGIWMKEKWRKRCRCCGSRSSSRNIRQENGIPGGGGNALQRVSHFGLLAHALPPPKQIYITRH